MVASRIRYTQGQREYLENFFFSVTPNPAQADYLHISQLLGVTVPQVNRTRVSRFKEAGFFSCFSLKAGSKGAV